MITEKDLIKLPHGNFPVPKSKLYWCSFMEMYHTGVNLGDITDKDRAEGKHVVQQDCCYAIKVKSKDNPKKNVDLSDEQIDEILKNK